MNFLKKMFGRNSAKEIYSLDKILRKFAEFYLDKNEGNLEYARDEIRRLGIKGIYLDDNDLVVTLSKPGLFIGRYGNNIINLENYLKVNLRIIESENVSDRIDTLLCILNDERDLHENYC